MARRESDNPDVHRKLFVDSDDPQRGRDVANLQRALSDRLEARGISAKELPVATHGKFTHATWVAGVEAGHWLGLRSDTYLKTERGDGPGGRAGVCTEGAQRIIRYPDERTAVQRERANVRRTHLEDAPRFAKLLRDADGPGGTGADAAVKWALAQVDTTEQPPGSNWGGKISDWIRATGYNSPVPWCGCFVNAAIIRAGVPSGAGWIGYTPAIVAHARRGTDGWKWVGPSEGRRGDLALFDTPGGDPAVHVGLVLARVDASTYDTVEGNTSSGPGGSQSNGGGVFRRQRSTGGTFHIIGHARPPY